jgi:hypothetical protein
MAQAVIGNRCTAGGHQIPAQPAKAYENLVSRDQVTLMQAANVVATDIGTLRDLSITPTPLEAILPTYLKRHSRAIKIRSCQASVIGGG